MKYSKYIFIAATIIMLSRPAMGCVTGGIGSTGCSYTVTNWLFYSIPIKSSTSISCGGGYYACCTSDDGECFPNSQAEPVSQKVMLACNVEADNNEDTEESKVSLRTLLALVPLVRLYK